ncbi:signal transduction histidine kinase/DNA-binding response OmpR family regulator [Methanofollis sp. W23]|uniref:hybrid sensor histidine kinase/response regulator n=1 Tax=Methanofollis sp. W23 TaxID=2817849 RepID=UPI001AE3A7FE|nr:ATP-binding protein [Methanofollis sp. W23]MBP2146291.1 signal transduction histidine kinase/DNA-binding response OmpR family regulator [Methanofollis sp. W23]
MTSILYVHNNAPPSDEVRECLEDGGAFSVTTTPSAGNALQVLHDRPFDAIISARSTGENDGISLLTHLREIGDPTPFIYLTGEEDESVIHALAHGADLCICRDCIEEDRHTFLKKVQALIHRKKRYPSSYPQSRATFFLDVLPAWTMVLDPQGKILYANQAAQEIASDVRGPPRSVVTRADPAPAAAPGGGLEGISVLSLTVEESRERLRIVIADACAGKETGPGEVWLKTPGEARIPVMVRAAPVTYLDEDAALLVLTDLTEQMALQKELEYHAAELRRFSESLARYTKKLTMMEEITRHDVLNQLTALLAHLEIAGEGGPGDHEYLDHLKVVRQAATAIRRQVEFTRTYQEVGADTPQWCALETIVAGLRPSTLAVRSEVKGVEIYADPLFEKVFFNLLDNTERHGEGAGNVLISCQENERGLRICWEDDGTGIRADEKEKIFRRGHGQNTGFGLYLSREILASTGIEIRETGREGEGARFEILVPDGRYRWAQDLAQGPHPSA